MQTDSFIQSKANVSVIVKTRFLEESKNTDLFAFNSYSGCCCAECAKLSGRVYSFSGRDKRFPKMPKALITGGGYHTACNTSLVRWWEGDNIYCQGEYVNAIQSTRRPHTDDRPEADTVRYQNALAKIQKDRANYENRKEFFVLRTLLPDLVPKSQYAFMQEKAALSPLYTEIINLAKGKGYVQKSEDRPEPSHKTRTCVKSI